MKATVREYREVRKVVVLEISEDECKRILDDTTDGGWTVGECTRRLVDAIESALEADRASNAQEDEDVPF